MPAPFSSATNSLLGLSDPNEDNLTEEEKRRRRLGLLAGVRDRTNQALGANGGAIPGVRTSPAVAALAGGYYR